LVVAAVAVQLVPVEIQELVETLVEQGEQELHHPSQVHLLLTQVVVVVVQIMQDYPGGAGGGGDGGGGSNVGGAWNC
jgi:hypothetical protein